MALEQPQSPNAGQPAFAVQKLYVKDASLEVPGAPGIFLEQTQPSVDLNLQTNATAMGDDHYEISVTATVSASGNDKAYFLVEATQAGVFMLRNFPDDQLETLMNVNCADILFPYLREVISDLTVRAGFPPIILAPVNFGGMYQQQKLGASSANA